MADTFCMVLSTAASQEEADRLAELLVRGKLAACVQILNIHSWYSWQGKVMKEPEYLLLIKTSTRRYQDVETAIRENHSYEVPEIIQVPVEQGLDRYLEWIRENTQAR